MNDDFNQQDQNIKDVKERHLKEEKIGNPLVEFFKIFHHEVNEDDTSNNCQDVEKQTKCNVEIHFVTRLPFY